MAKRKWIIRNDDRYETEEHFREAVAGELAAFEHIGYRAGLCVVASPVRRRNPRTDEIETLAWVFETATVPLITDGQQPEEMRTPEPEPEPHEVEDLIDMVHPVSGEERTVPESDVSDLMEDGWEPVPQDHSEPATVGSDPYAE